VKHLFCNLKMEAAGIVERKDDKWCCIIDELTQEVEAALAERLNVKGTIRQRERIYQVHKEVSDWEKKVFTADEVGRRRRENQDDEGSISLEQNEGIGPASERAG
jgi:hypothetical protein